MKESILGSISSDDFLAQYWQQKPLLIKAALPNFKSPLSPDQLAGLALEDDIESRLITGNNTTNNWTVQQGPFDESIFSQLPEQDWTLLVQGVDQWIDGVRNLIDYFNFLPRWRIDDIMVSYAATGGSVGPHFDYYDVFLLQGMGTREWQIGNACDESNPLLDNIDLKILKQFTATQHWVLEPGDMLYLPPTIAHQGTSLSDDCLTYSIGFRSPTGVEMLNDLAVELMSRNDIAVNHLKDPPLNTTNVGNNLPAGYLQQLKQLLTQTLDNPALLEDWFATYMTKPKNPELDETSNLSKQKILEAIEAGTVHNLLPNARIIKTAQGVYINGEKL